MLIRPGSETDVPAVLRLLDGAIAWLAAQGRTGQWGSAPLSTEPRQIAQVQGYAQPGGLWLAEMAGEVVGALAVGAAGAGIPTVDEPEVFVRLLVTDRSRAGAGIGASLLDHARKLAQDAGIALLRVDCYAGGDGKLVRYYESQGFSRTQSFDHDGWPGQVLEQRLTSA
ncbi:GNAT family N-acetyltransferase [Actinoplanes sp. N902-109]|uniref:GNAT family N-acetyltransferase n=1 Tax=Actinoplanes sp. (strain N902-109) TaxID=649831 RepID=UPI000329450E|nr:GNAT family N-acetyltransferase [Actinoplanes sp. N902-109]AGL18084.1 GCN5-related N-acetyltransferase [Actinoplanes sp. N902-109]